MKTIKSVHLQYVDEESNSNKVWEATLFENDDVLCAWGRFDSELQSKLFPGVGEIFLDKKMNSKLKKGYELV
ncbi:MAG: WGR domain-containing protein [bacterium]|nr:WGR domain-containing protein [bacterium]